MIICAGALLAIVLLIPADIEFLASIYAFGATISFTIVHLSVIRLRWREPERDRPFKMPLNLRVGGGELPVTAALGALMSAAAFVAVVALHDERALGRHRVDGRRDRALRRLPAGRRASRSSSASRSRSAR